MLSKVSEEQESGGGRPEKSLLVYRQTLWTRTTHWLWAICLFFLLFTGLQIFNAHPALYVGDQSGFQFDNYVLTIGVQNGAAGPRGVTELLGTEFDTTGILGLSEQNGRPVARAFPAWATIPSGHDLATARVIHFFFAWLLVATLLAWLAASLADGHLRRDLAPRTADLRRLPRDVLDHVTLRFRHARDYNPLQKLAYGAVLFAMLPVMILTGLAMSPSTDALIPWLPELFGGRQTARTVHFAVMLLLVGFFIVHMLMILAAGPFNELRSIITGWYRIDPAPPTHPARGS